MASSSKTLILFVFVVVVAGGGGGDAAAMSIGVNYGALADNLPPPSQVAAFLKSRTLIDRVKLFDANPDVIRAFSGTGISLAITAPNGDIPALARTPGFAASFVSSSVAPFYPSVNITLVLVGNEIMATADKSLIARLVPAMRALRSALDSAGFRRVRVSTPHSLGIISSSPDSPSSGRFRRGYDNVIFAPMLQFHRETHSPFVVNPYPYFGYGASTLDYALFRPNAGVLDESTKIRYSNMFDAQMDAVYSAMKRVGYGDVEIAVGETGWPSVGDPGQVGVNADSARDYNGELIRRVNSGIGTPLMPHRKFESYIFALFNENLKPGPTAERNWGLFRPDLTPVYDVGILRAQTGGPTPGPSPGAGKAWCVAKGGSTVAALQANIDYACGTGNVNCRAIQAGGACFDPNTIQNHASYVMNAYYQAAGRHDFNCDFGHTGVLTTSNPSYGGCQYSS